jgi:hypothetical protein
MERRTGELQRRYQKHALSKPENEWSKENEIKAEKEENEEEEEDEEGGKKEEKCLSWYRGLMHCFDHPSCLGYYGNIAVFTKVSFETSTGYS